MCSRLGFKPEGDLCCAVGCSHKRSNSTCSFLSFPTNKKWFDVWVNAINRCQVDENGRVIKGSTWTPKGFHRLCTCHFSEPPNTQKRLAGWKHRVPDKLLPKKKITLRTTAKSTDRPYIPAASTSTADVQCHDLVQATGIPIDVPTRPDRCIDIMDLEDVHVQAVGIPIDVPTRPDRCIENMNADYTYHDHDYLATPRSGQIAAEVDRLKVANPEFWKDYEEAKKTEKLYHDMARKGQIFTLNLIKDDDTIFNYYTGLPSYRVFTCLYRYLHPLAEGMQYVSQAGNVHHGLLFRNKPGKERALSLEVEFFATLVRLRLGLPSKDCARRFGISESTFSDIFNTWVILLSQQLEVICAMPSSDKISECQATCFDNFFNVRIVLDCTEIFSQTPGSLDAHKQVHSNYKHHSTIKFLVGMSPGGAILYISDMWGGRASDKKITKESDKLLSSLDAGDKVMVDRGFTIAEDFPTGVKLLIPPFKNRNTGQLSKEQLEYSEKISAARIHVERAMRAIKECRLLEFEVKLAMMNNFENIFKACAYLVNFKRPFLKINS